MLISRLSYKFIRKNLQDTYKRQKKNFIKLSNFPRNDKHIQLS